jgi:hypothetical protein
VPVCALPCVRLGTLLAAKDAVSHALPHTRCCCACEGCSSVACMYQLENDIYWLQSGCSDSSAIVYVSRNWAVQRLLICSLHLVLLIRPDQLGSAYHHRAPYYGITTDQCCPVPRLSILTYHVQHDGQRLPVFGCLPVLPNWADGANWPVSRLLVSHFPTPAKIKAFSLSMSICVHILGPPFS